MDCWYPITVGRHNNYKGSDGLVYTHVYGKMQVPCGRCPACRRRKQNEWAFRIMEEVKYTKLCAFITLTYSDESLPISDLGIPTLFPDHLTTFNKNLRYDLRYKNPNNPKEYLSYRFFACGEYGDQFERPHMHMMIFYNGHLDHDQIKSYVEKRWIHGFIDYEIGVTAGRAKYIAKYSMKQVGFDYEDAVPPFARMSRMPGIGKQFLDMLDYGKFRKFQQWHVHDYQGTPYTLPRYYKESIYSKDECMEHSMLLEKLKNVKEDISIRTMESYHEYKRDQLLDYDRKFIRMLRKENYGFRYKPFKYYDKRHEYNKGSEFITDEF